MERQDISPGVGAWALHVNDVSGKPATPNPIIAQSRTQFSVAETRPETMQKR